MPNSIQSTASFDDLFTDLLKEDDRAAKKNLQAGITVYYGDDNHQDQLVKHYPSGRKELICVDDNGNETLTKVLAEKGLEMSMEEKLKIIHNVQASEALEGYAPLTEGYAYEVEQKWVTGEITLEQKGKLLADHYGFAYSG